MNKEFGDFTIFGFSKKPKQFIQNEVFNRLEIVPRFIDFGDIGHLFFYSTYGERCESEENIFLKLGFVRSPQYGVLSTQQIIDHKVIGLDSVEENELHGNALIINISKITPRFSIYKTLIAVPQLYFSTSTEGIICSDRLKVLTWTMDRPELNENILPMHFLFRTTIGSSTYLRNIEKMLPGQFMRWSIDEMHLDIKRNLQFDNEPIIHGVNDESLSVLYQSVSGVIADYSQQTNNDEQRIGNLLSGGVDSSLLQHILNEQQNSPVNRSYSFAAKASSFQFEVDYAIIASQHFHTDHTFIHITEDDYPALLNETIDSLSCPPLLPSEPGIYSVAKYIRDMNIPIRFFLSGQGADALFGYQIAKKIKLAQNLSIIPGSANLILNLGKILQLVHPYGKSLLIRGEKLLKMNDSASYLSPLNTIAVYADYDKVVRCFEEKEILDALEKRRNLTELYKKGENYLEKVFLIDLITDSYEVASERHQLFLSQFREIIHPFLDEDILRTGFRFPPDVRYIYKNKEKYLLKAILSRKSGLATTWKPKGGAQFFDDFYEWMRVGALRPLVDGIELPGFINRKDFEKLTQKPDIFLWSLLVLDLFQKRVLNMQREFVGEAHSR